MPTETSTTLIATHDGVSLPTILLALEQRLAALEQRLAGLEAAIEARSAPASEIRQALHDILNIYNIAGQTGSVVSQQRDQIAALVEAMTCFHAELVDHDLHATDERTEIHGLMVQLRTLARKQVAQLDDLEAASGMTLGERAALRDLRDGI